MISVSGYNPQDIRHEVEPRAGLGRIWNSGSEVEKMISVSGYNPQDIRREVEPRAGMEFGK